MIKYYETAKPETKQRGSGSALNCFVMRFHNAKKAIAQIRNGEWEPLWNPLSKTHLTAHKDGMEMWLGNGAFFCEIKDRTGVPYFGLIWRHWVYWAASRKLRINADKRYKRENPGQPVL